MCVDLAAQLSAIALSACLVASYGAEFGFAIRPLLEFTKTIWPRSDRIRWRDRAANDPAYRADVLPPMTNFPSRNLVVAPGPSPYQLIRYEPPTR